MDWLIAVPVLCAGVGVLVLSIGLGSLHARVKEIERQLRDRDGR